MAARGGRPSADRPDRQARAFFGIFLLMMVVDAATIHVPFDVPFRGDPCCRGGGLPAHHRPIFRFGALWFCWRGTRLRPEPHRHLLLAGLRLRRRGFPGPGDGRLPRRPGARSCRCAGTCRSCSTRRRAACRPRTPSGRFMVLAGLACLFFALAWLRLRAIAVRRRDARTRPRPACDTGEASPSR